MDAGGAKADLSSNAPASAASRWSLSQRFQHLLDKSTPFVLQRWIAFAAVAIVYVIRVWFAEGFYIVSYALGIYILNLLISFLSPQVDPEFQDLSDGPTLPTLSSDEFRPFVRRLPEFKFWCVASRLVD
ncbi:Rer1 family protein [Actinidia rufa]|uniref:Rer1 family protein n=1 Tax=Actinidia rufa TaxID=165716 RepID=A0A7J0F781_9ERIC|nr:Rer1 family protein [Actinidia rufa]